ncbi:IS3 family transposase [Arcanobacterium pinnipediorum]|uniref:IS3 family transposase n=1 Tax=Arcanobacterium pinnipediorum TaxID=1503041 RepID=A0ABY5AJC0_9ACTO|nr:IS3 family transposase [Arcanobacterium pinnipediorum]USR79746.1 IS3 family transposase [Arcanobacterium pinnipediorum]USR79950.1 IS3 family transposase [Arcanobacterium pinnipediorum]
MDIHASNYGVYGVRKMWRALGRAWIMIGCEQTARFMCLAGLLGKGKGRSSVVS